MRYKKYAFILCGERGIRTLHVQYTFWIFCSASPPNYLKRSSNAHVKRLALYSLPLKKIGPLQGHFQRAERGGFEPPIHLRVYYLSKVARSTTLPSLRLGEVGYLYHKVLYTRTSSTKYSTLRSGSAIVMRYSCSCFSSISEIVSSKRICSSG